MKKLLLSALILTQMGCASWQKSKPEEVVPPTSNNQPESSPIHNGQDAMNVDPESIKKVLDSRSVGLILGPGGVKSLAHIGVLHEFVSNKVPISYVAGIEWGALIGAMYAHQGRIHEAEWKSLKIPSQKFYSQNIFKKSKIKPDVNVFQDFLKTTFAQDQLQDAPIKFMCSTDTSDKSKIMLRGKFKDVLRLCWPDSSQFENKTASVNSVGAFIEKMESLGVNTIILVNVIGEADLSSEDLKDQDEWNKYLENFKSIKSSGELAGIIDINISKFGIRDYESGRDIIRMARQQARPEIKRLIKLNNL